MTDKDRAKLARLLADERTLPRENVELRLTFLQEIAALAPANRGYAQRRDYLQREVDEVRLMGDLPSRGAELIKTRWRAEAFGTVMVADFTIRNRSLSNLKDFRVMCTGKGGSGTAISTSTRTVTEVLSTRTTKTFRNVNMGFIDPQTKAAECGLEGAEIG